MTFELWAIGRVESGLRVGDDAPKHTLAHRRQER